MQNKAKLLTTLRRQYQVLERKEERIHALKAKLCERAARLCPWRPGDVLRLKDPVTLRSQYVHIRQVTGLPFGRSRGYNIYAYNCTKSGVLRSHYSRVVFENQLKTATLVSTAAQRLQKEARSGNHG